MRVGLERVSVALVCGVAGVGKSSLASAFAAGWPGPVAYCRTAAEPSLAVLCEDALRQLGASGAVELAAVAAALDERGALWVLDDLHRLVLADSGHMSTRDQPAALTDAIVGFVEKWRERSRATA